MNAQRLREALDAIAAMPGMDGCALVEIEAGMVWHSAGHIGDVQQFAEAASDYWRLYWRLSHHFTGLGDLRASVMIHTNGRITMLPCGKGMLLVALTRQDSPVEWSEWQIRARQLAKLVDQL